MSLNPFALAVLQQTTCFSTGARDSQHATCDKQDDDDGVARRGGIYGTAQARILYTASQNTQPSSSSSAKHAHRIKNRRSWGASLSRANGMANQGC